MAEFFTYITEGSGEKTGQLCSSIGACLSGIVISITINPYFGLCLLCYLPFATCVMLCFGKRVRAMVMNKFRNNAALGGFTEEMLSSLKLIISFGMEKEKLAEYEKIATTAFKSARKAEMTIGFMGGITFATMVGFTVTAWSWGFLFVKYGVENPRAGRVTNVTDIVSCYQAIMFGMFTVISILNIYPMVVRALTSGHEVLKVIER